MKMGILEMCILSIISAEGEAYPSDMIQRLKEYDLIVVEGTLYPLLTRLKNDGYLGYTWQESRTGPPRKYYQVTPSGVAFLSELMEAWAQLVSTVHQTTKTINHE